MNEYTNTVLQARKCPKSLTIEATYIQSPRPSNDFLPPSVPKCRLFLHTEYPPKIVNLV